MTSSVGRRSCAVISPSGIADKRQLFQKESIKTEKLIITAAICGAEVTKEQNPAVPYTLEEMVREAKSAYDAGAAVIHVHVRWDDGTPTQDRERFRVVMDAIQAACPGVILIPSTGGAVGMTPEERLQPTELMPEMATLDCGTCNFGDDVFVNDLPILRAFGKRMLENHIKPEYECFEMGHVDTILKLANKGLVPGAPMQFNFVLGVAGCTPATAGNLDWLLEGAGELPPEVLGRLQEDSRVKQSAALSARAIHFFIFIVFSSHSFTWWMYFLFPAVP